jgi:hypothetical protein
MHIMNKSTILAIGLLIGLASFGACAGVIDMSMDHFVQGLPYLSAIGMTTLAADQQRAYELGERNDIGVIAADIIYEGAAVGDNASGYARPLVAGDPFLGFATETADNSAGAAGAKNVNLRTSGRVQLAIGSLAITDLGKQVYASDDNTFTLTATSNSAIGRVVRFVSSGIGIVEFDVGRGGVGNITALTDSTTGTADGTVADVGAAFSQATLNNNFKELVVKINQLAAQIK